MRLKALDHYQSAEAEIGVKASVSVRTLSSAAREANVTNHRRTSKPHITHWHVRLRFWTHDTCSQEALVLPRTDLMLRNAAVGIDICCSLLTPLRAYLEIT